jgi:hypothetical protein
VNELRSLFAVQMVRGGLLRSDGVGVGLVGGGAPQSELMSRHERSLVAADYHRLLLALDAPLDVYTVDQPHEVAAEIGLLLARQGRAIEAGRGLHAAVLGDICDYLHELEQHTSSRAKYVVWAVTSDAGAGASRAAPGLAGLLCGAPPGGAMASAGRQALAQAVGRARRLAEALAALGGVPQPRLLEREEIASLLYRHADPVRAARYPLAGSLLERVRRVVGAAPE